MPLDRPHEPKCQNRRPRITDLPEELLQGVLRRCLQSPSCSPRQYSDLLLVCSQFCDTCMSPAVLRVLPPSVLQPRFEHWSDSNLHFLRSCAAAGNNEALFLVGMIHTYCLNDPHTGSALLTRAAMGGHVAALHSLAIVHLNNNSILHTGVGGNHGRSNTHTSVGGNHHGTSCVHTGVGGNQRDFCCIARGGCNQDIEVVTSTASGDSRSSSSSASSVVTTSSDDDRSDQASSSANEQLGSPVPSSQSSAPSSAPTATPAASAPPAARTAVHLLLRAAQRGHVASLVDLAHCLLEGVGVGRNERGARVLLAHATALQLQQQQQRHQQEQQQQQQQRQRQRENSLCQLPVKPVAMASAPAASRPQPAQQQLLLPVPRHPIHAFLRLWREGEEAGKMWEEREEMLGQWGEGEDAGNRCRVRREMLEVTTLQQLQHMQLVQKQEPVHWHEHHQLCGNSECGRMETGPGSFRRCVRCSVAYCSRSCQLEDWAREHGFTHVQIL